MRPHSARHGACNCTGHAALLSASATARASTLRPLTTLHACAPSPHASCPCVCGAPLPSIPVHVRPQANDGDDCSTYGCKLASLAHDWRTTTFGQPSLAFTFDQLRADDGAAGMGVPAFAARVIPNATFASRVDLQTCLPSNTSEGHAVRKLEVGRRLALALRVALYGEPPAPLSFGPRIHAADAQPTAVRTPTGKSKVHGRLLNVTVRLEHAAGLHHADAPECAGCCHGRGGALVRGTPRTGDAWAVTLADGVRRTVCQDAASGCDGAAIILPSGGVSFLIDAPEPLVAAAARGEPVVEAVEYGGDGPWKERDQPATRAPRPEALECVYPHPPRFGVEACALYNGVGGFDDHAGIAMAAQRWAAARAALA